MSRLRSNLKSAYFSDKINASNRDVDEVRRIVKASSHPMPPRPRTAQTPPQPTPGTVVRSNVEVLTAIQRLLQETRDPIPSDGGVPLTTVLRQLLSAFGTPEDDVATLKGRIEELSALARRQRDVIARQETLLHNVTAPRPPPRNVMCQTTDAYPETLRVEAVPCVRCSRYQLDPDEAAKTPTRHVRSAGVQCTK